LTKTHDEELQQMTHHTSLIISWLNFCILCLINSCFNGYLWSSSIFKCISRL